MDNEIDQLQLEFSSITIESKQEETSSISTLLKQINWQKFHNLCIHIGDDLNSQQWRFLKAVILENAISIYSDNLLVYVGNDTNGCDFIIPSHNNAKIEMKYVTGALYTDKKVLRAKCKQITLLNSKGTNTHVNLPDTYADYLLIVETFGSAIISKENLKKYVKCNGDSLSAIIPTSELEIICSYITDTPVEKKQLNIKHKIIQMVNEIITNL